MIQQSITEQNIKLHFASKFQSHIFIVETNNITGFQPVFKKKLFKQINSYLSHILDLFQNMTNYSQKEKEKEGDWESLGEYLKGKEGISIRQVEEEKYRRWLQVSKQEEDD